MEQRDHTLSFTQDLTGLCRAAFGPSWAPKSAAPDAMAALEQTGWVPEELLAFYRTAGGEPRLLLEEPLGGFLPADKVFQEPKGPRWGPYLVYYETARGSGWSRCAYARDHQPKNNGIFAWRGCVEGWEQVYPFVSVHTLSDVLLSQAGRLLAARMPHCIWVKVPLKTAGAEGWREKDRAAYLCAVERLELTPLESIAWYGDAYAFGAEDGCLLEFSTGAQKRCVVYSRDPAALERFGEKFPAVWLRRDGKRILDPSQFIVTPAPAAFEEKLEELSSILLGKRSMELSREELEWAEQRLGQHFPAPLTAFYRRFGRGGKLFSNQSLHTIFTPAELSFHESGGLVLMEENQGVWRLCLGRDGEQLYLDLGRGERRAWDMALEDTLLWMLANNSLGFLPRGGPCSLGPEEDSLELLGHYFHLIPCGDDQTILSAPQRGLLGLRCSDGTAYIKARQGKVLDKLERDTGILVGEL